MAPPPDRITLDSPAGIPLPMLWASSGVILFLWVWIGWFHPLLSLDENQALYIYSSASQVIAAVYGLTLAGYVFLRNEQNRLVDGDPTLAEIFEMIQGREHAFVLLLSTMSTLAILASLLAIGVGGASGDALRYGMVNAATALFVLSISLTTLFIVEALRPGKVVRTSDAIKGELAAHPPGAAQPPAASTPAQLVEFLVQYNGLERVLDQYGAFFEPAVPAGAAGADARPRLGTQKILGLMEAQAIITGELAQEIRAIARYRNALLHGNDMTVDPWMLARLRVARASLEEAVRERLQGTA
jgi:hypothetical protein